LSLVGSALPVRNRRTYNCIAWAAEDTTRWWWPDSQNYWPKEIPRKRNLDAFVQLFQSLGYEICEKADLEEGFKKVAIFVGAAGIPTHAARQQDDGSWTSKLGNHHDISHELEQVGGFAGKSYGKVAAIMKRPRNHGGYIP